jgi:hypothetical protein
MFSGLTRVCGVACRLISGKSIQLLRLLFDTVSPLQVAQYLSHTALHEKDKLRHTALKFLADVMPVFCADHDAVISISKKYRLPSGAHLCTLANYGTVIFLPYTAE